MHIFLTGEKQVGKSTLVRRLIQSTERKVCGLKSVSIFENGDRNVYLFPAAETNLTSENGVLGGVCRNHHVVERHPENFDKYGVSLLSEIPSGSLVVIDEIGNMEAEAKLYSKAIVEILERKDILVLGVVQKMARTELAQSIREHKGIRLFEVTPENRETLYGTIKGEIK